jgi:hypothetical protein
MGADVNTVANDIAARGLGPASSAASSYAPRLAVSLLAFFVLAAFLVSWQPLQLSVATVFVFAGPHNWMEFRYFVARMPARWGRSKTFFAVGIGGVVLLSAAYALRSGSRSRRWRGRRRSGSASRSSTCTRSSRSGSSTGSSNARARNGARPITRVSRRCPCSWR